MSTLSIGLSAFLSFFLFLANLNAIFNLVQVDSCRYELPNGFSVSLFITTIDLSTAETTRIGLIHLTKTVITVLRVNLEKPELAENSEFVATETAIMA